MSAAYIPVGMQWLQDSIYNIYEGQHACIMHMACTHMDTNKQILAGLNVCSFHRKCPMKFFSKLFNELSHTS